MDYFRNKIREHMEYRFIERTIKTNAELLEHMASTIGWLLHYCEKNGINPPNEYQLRRSVDRAQKLLRNLPNQPTGNTNNNSRQDNSTLELIVYLFMDSFQDVVEIRIR